MDLTIMKFIQQLISPEFDVFFKLITNLGTQMIGLICVAIIYYCFDKKAGEYLIFGLVFSYTGNNILKDIVRRPRPIGQPGIVTNPDAAADIAIGGSGYPYSWSFPSGHAQGAASLATNLSLVFKKGWVIAVSAVLTLLVMISRVYLGVHYPSDVLVGAILGVGFGFLTWWCYNRFYDKRMWIYIGIALLTLPTLFFASADTAKSVGAFCGLAAGVLFEQKLVGFSTAGVWWKKLLRLVLGVALLAGVRALTKAILPDNVLCDWLRYFITLFLATGLYPWIFTRLRL